MRVKFNKYFYINEDKKKSENGFIDNERKGIFIYLYMNSDNVELDQVSFNQVLDIYVLFSK